MSTVYAGLDWASQTHVVCVINAAGKVVLQIEVSHDMEGLVAMSGRLRAAGVEQMAIERPSGLLVDFLMEQKFVVVPVHPNIVKASRPRYRSHGGKSDASDAYLLADLLRTDGHRFRPLSAQSDSIRALRTLVRGRDDLVGMRVQLANQLRSLLDSYWPGAAHIFADIDSAIALAFIVRYPTPESAARLGLTRMAAFCKKQRYSGQRSPAELLARLRAAPSNSSLGDRESRVKGDLARALAQSLAGFVEQIKRLSTQIEEHVATIDEGRILMSFPRAGRICAAQIVAELGDVRERFDSDDRLAAEAGVAPVTKESGKHRAVVFRWACNHRLRAAVTCFANNSRYASDWAASIYNQARERGCDHVHAIRILARAWIRVIWRAWTDRKPYDVEQHGGAKRLLAGG
jgi:transposase